MRRSYFRLLEGVLLGLPLLFASCGNGDNALEEIINGGGSGGGSSAVTEITIDLTAIADEYLNDEKTQLELKVGDEVTLSFTIKPDELADTEVTLTPEDPTIVSIDGKKVKALLAGTTKVTAKAGDKSATCTVTVTEPYAANEYNEGSWDGTKVVFTKKTADSDPQEIANDYTGTITSGWYTVTGDNVTLGTSVSPVTFTLTDDVHLILQDGATLTINGKLNAGSHNLYIYGQKKGDGKLNVTNNSATAINSNTGYRIEIHGGEVTASAAGNYNFGLNTGYLAVYGGKLTATSGGGNGITFWNTFDVYGGEVVATSNATSSDYAYYGIISGGGLANQTLTVYGGKVTATGNGKAYDGEYGSGFRCYVKSGTSGIKFYFTGDTSNWGDGTGYPEATKVGSDDATKKRYAKAE